MSDKSKKCLSVGNSGTLSVIYHLSVSSLQPTPAYVEAWNIYQKLDMYIIVVDPLRDWFLRPFFGQIGNTVLCLKNAYKNEWFLHLVAHIFTKLS